MVKAVVKGSGDGPEAHGEDDTPPKEDSGDEGGVKKPKGLDYWLGTKEGRARLLVVFWVTSVTFMAFGYGLIIWIWLRGGL
jgi:hypothetical protein